MLHGVDLDRDLNTAVDHVVAGSGQLPAPRRRARGRPGATRIRTPYPQSFAAPSLGATGLTALDEQPA